jgi:L-lysine 2,3-aminomutase
VNLSEALFKSGTLPYYLHQLDRVAGAAHFEVKETRALELINEVQRHLPGYLVPKLVREVAGKPHKTHILDTN